MSSSLPLSPSLHPVPRASILTIAPYVGGERGDKTQQKLIRLASNENTRGPSPRAIEAYQQRALAIHRYPDGAATELRTAIGEIYHLESERIICGNGSDELLHLIAMAYSGEGDEILYSEHGFLVYPIAARTSGATPIAVPETNYTASVDALLAAVTPRTKIVFLANPNNPTGSYLTPSEMARLHAGLPPHVLLVLDEAYQEYITVPDYQSGLALARMAENVVVTHTFSKIYGLAGLRVGFAYAAPAVIDALNRIRGPFNVNEAALAAAIAAVHDQDYVTQIRQDITATRDKFVAQLRQLGLASLPAVANFVLVQFPSDADAQAAFQFLKQRGILTRLVVSYGLPEFLRITVGTDEEMHDVSQALAEFLALG